MIFLWSKLEKDNESFFPCSISFNLKRRFSISRSHLKWHFPKLCFFAEFSDMSVLVHLGSDFRLWTLSLDGLAGQKLPSSRFNFIYGSVSTADFGVVTSSQGKCRTENKQKPAKGPIAGVFVFLPLSLSLRLSLSLSLRLSFSWLTGKRSDTEQTEAEADQYCQCSVPQLSLSPPLFAKYKYKNKQRQMQK